MTEQEFGSRLRQYRKEKKMTQQELADALGVSNKSVSRWESGGYPDVALLGPLAAALGVTVDDLLGTRGPVRTLTRADWQSLLSFAFTLGGGILFFALCLFTPVPLAYLLYIAAMAYGVYFQRHYAYRSSWFYLTNLVMDFFVNFRLVILFQGILINWQYQVFFNQDSDVLTELFQTFSPNLWSLPQYIGGAVGLTVVTAFLIYLSGRRRRSRRRRRKTSRTHPNAAARPALWGGPFRVPGRRNGAANAAPFQREGLGESFNPELTAPARCGDTWRTPWPSRSCTVWASPPPRRGSRRSGSPSAPPSRPGSPRCPPPGPGSA